MCRLLLPCGVIGFLLGRDRLLSGSEGTIYITSGMLADGGSLSTPNRLRAQEPLDAGVDRLRRRALFEQGAEKGGKRARRQRLLRRLQLGEGPPAHLVDVLSRKLFLGQARTEVGTGCADEVVALDLPDELRPPFVHALARPDAGPELGRF